MRGSIVLLFVSMAGLVGGAWLVGTWAVGVAVMADSVALGLWALFRDDGRGQEASQVAGVPTLADVLERARRSA